MELIIPRGDSPTFTITCVDDAEVPINLTGVTSLTFTAKRTFSDPVENALMSKTIGAGIVATNLAGGVVTLQFFPADTSSVPVVQTYRDQYWSEPLYWDLQLVDGTGLVYTLDSGTLLVRGDVTTPVSPIFAVASSDLVASSDNGSL